MAMSAAPPLPASLIEGLEIPSDLPALDNILAGERTKARKGPSEFELNLGNAIDALRVDVETFPDRELRWDVYTDDVVLADPSAVQSRGIESYKQFFGMIRAFRRFVVDRAEVTYKLRYDWSGKRIVVTWYSKWTMKGMTKAAHVDAVSYFHLNDAGLIFKHEVDRVEINGEACSPPYGLRWGALKARMFDSLAPVPAVAFEGLR